VAVTGAGRSDLATMATTGFAIWKICAPPLRERCRIFARTFALPAETGAESNLALAQVLRGGNHGVPIQVGDAAVRVQPQVRDVGAGFMNRGVLVTLNASARICRFKFRGRWNCRKTLVPRRGARSAQHVEPPCRLLSTPEPNHRKETIRQRRRAANSQRMGLTYGKPETLSRTVGDLHATGAASS
jgi:hypothetical protein